MRAIAWGTAGSLLGGLVFTVIMVQVGALPIIAGIVRGSDAATGLVVHFVISIIIGVLYALLFSNQATSFGSAAGWGAAYPASFIGHIAYGIVTAVYVYAVERQYRGESAPRPVAAPGAQSALWILVASFVVLVPVMLH